MGVERTPNKESAHRVNSGEENSPAARAGTRYISITSPALYQTSYPGLTFKIITMIIIIIIIMIIISIIIITIE